MKNRLDPVFAPHKANFLFEYETTYVPFNFLVKKTQNDYFRNAFLEAVVGRFDAMKYNWVVLSYHITDTKTVVLVSIAMASKFRCIIEEVVNEELGNFSWALKHSYGKSHSFLGAVRRFRHTEKNDQEVSKIQIQIDKRNPIKKKQVRNVLESIYPSTFINWKPEDPKKKKKPFFDY